MKISLIDMDYEHSIRITKRKPKNRFPNYALMKISAYHKSIGDYVDWYPPFMSSPDKIYISKVFSFTSDCVNLLASDPDPITGGTGYDINSKLPIEIDQMHPDYSIYPDINYAIGFLSRGCIRNCSFCVVPKKEGNIHQVSDIAKIAQGRKHIVLMDNNFLANDQLFVKEQIEKSIKLGLSIDFNQGLDARLVTEENAHWLSLCRWKAATGNNSYIRFSCDHQQIIGDCKNAIFLLRRSGYNGSIFFYLLAKEVDETIDRMNQLLSFDKKIKPFVMPYRNLDGDGKITDKKLSTLARWCNMESIRKSCKFSDYI